MSFNFFENISTLNQYENLNQKGKKKNFNHQLTSSLFKMII